MMTTAERATALEVLERRHRERLWRDFRDFARLHLSSRDIDPVYPVLAALEDRIADEEEQLWMTLLYVTFYNLASAVEAFAADAEPDRFPEELAKLPTGTERRGFRDPPKLLKHVAALAEVRERHGSFTAWLNAGLTEDDPEGNWRILQDNIASVWGNGRWAAYKLAEILYRVHAWDVFPTDMGHAHSSGPREGQGRLYAPLEGNDAETVATLEEQGREILAWLQASNVPVADVALVETSLCDFNSMVKGGYYIGHDIDLMQAQYARQPVPEQVRRQIYGARMDTLPRTYLGEVGGWTGPDKARCRVYAERGLVLGR